MKTTNHTPGPWKYDSTWGLIKYGKTEICALHSGNEANAHLIAAAPDLLNILSDGVHMFSKLTGENLLTFSRTFAALARAAISKAEGAK